MSESSTAVELPEVGDVADLVPASLADTYLCWVEEVGNGQLVVTGPVDAQLRPVRLVIGERIDLVWRGEGGLRCLPVELIDIEPAERPRWRLASAGVVKRGQRRDAVRAPMSARVILGAGPTAIAGTTVDVSEGGLRCVLERRPVRVPADALGPTPAIPDVGDVVHLSVVLVDATIRCLAEVSRRHPRHDERVELSLRFISLSEHEQDRIRQRVFARLRDLRRRGLL